MAIEKGLIRKSDKKNLQKAGNLIREKYGVRFYVEVLAERIKGKKHTINGIRKPEELTFLREFLEEVIVVGITADDDKRYRRLRDKKIVKTYEEFEEIENNETEADIDRLLENADYKLENNGTLEEFHDKVDELLTKISFIK